MQTNQAIIPGVEILYATFSLFLIQVIIILGICELLSWIGVYFHQPRVIFEILGGIILGPSVLGNISSYTYQLFPASSISIITVVAQLGLNFYIFIIGLELDYSMFGYNAGKTSAIALTSMIIPFGLGIAISPLLYSLVQVKNESNSDFSGKGTTQQFISFFVFVGTALSITAFPVLARIINETPLKHTKIGGITLCAAAINDAVAWVLLVIAISLARSSSSLSSLFLIIVMVCYTCFMFTFGRYLLGKFVNCVENQQMSVANWPLLERWRNRNPDPDSPLTSGEIAIDEGRRRIGTEKRLHHLFVAIIILFLASGYFVSLLGIDSIIGALIFGIIVPRNSKIHQYCLSHLTYFTIYFFLPIYFTSSGLKTDFTQLNLTPDFWLLLLVIAVATAGKLGGAGIVSYLFGYSTRESIVIAVLMNTRGLVELIVLNIGLKAGILNQQIFSIFVIMCLFTTMISYPLVSWIYKKEIGVVKREQREIGFENELEDGHGNNGNHGSHGSHDGAIELPVMQDRVEEGIMTPQIYQERTPISTVLPEEDLFENSLTHETDLSRLVDLRCVAINDEEWKEASYEDRTDPRRTSSASRTSELSGNSNDNEGDDQLPNAICYSNDLEEGRGRSRTFGMDFDQLHEIYL